MRRLHIGFHFPIKSYIDYIRIIVARMLHAVDVEKPAIDTKLYTVLGMVIRSKKLGQPFTYVPH